MVVNKDRADTTFVSVLDSASTWNPNAIGAADNNAGVTEDIVSTVSVSGRATGKENAVVVRPLITDNKVARDTRLNVVNDSASIVVFNGASLFNEKVVNVTGLIVTPSGLLTGNPKVIADIAGMVACNDFLWDKADNITNTPSIISDSGRDTDNGEVIADNVFIVRPNGVCAPVLIVTDDIPPISNARRRAAIKVSDTVVAVVIVEIKPRITVRVYPPSPNMKLPNSSTPIIPDGKIAERASI